MITRFVLAFLIFISGAASGQDTLRLIPDGKTDNYATIVKMVAQIDTGRIDFAKHGDGDFYFSKTIYVMNKSIKFLGGDKTRLLFPQGVIGLHITRTKSVAPSWIKDLTVRAVNSKYLADKVTIAYPQAHGILIETQTHFDNVLVSNFGGDGIRFYGSIVNAKTNVSHCNVQNIDVIGCNNGVYIDGPDANNILLTNVDVRDNWGYGIYDGSFLGITVINAQGHSNRKGHFVTDPEGGRNSRTRWIGCYNEGGSPPSIAAGHSTVYGGNKSSGWKLMHYSKYYASDLEIKANIAYLKSRDEAIAKIKVLRLELETATIDRGIEILAEIRSLARPMGIIDEEL